MLPGAQLPLTTPPTLVPQKPTTGLLAITLALHLCDVVHIAGFGYPDPYNRKQTIHYYEQITLKSMAVRGPVCKLGGAAQRGARRGVSGAGGPEGGHSESELAARPLDSQASVFCVWPHRLFFLKGGTGKGAPRLRGGGGGGGQGGCPGPGAPLGAPQFSSLAVSTGVGPQCLPRGPGHQTDAGNRSSQEPHLLLTWAGAVPIRLPTLLPERPPATAVGVPGARGTSPVFPCLCGEGSRDWPGLRRGHARLLWWKPALVQVEALGSGSPAKERGLLP